MKCELYLQAAYLPTQPTNTWYMPGALLCLEDAMRTKIISPCPQRGGGRDELLTQVIAEEQMGMQERIC